MSEKSYPRIKLLTGLLLGLSAYVLLYLQSDLTQIQVRFLVKGFAYSRSDFKIYLLFGFLVLLAAFETFPVRRLVHSLHQALLVLTLGLLFLGVGEFAYVQHSLGLPLSERIVAIADGVSTSSSLYHIHNSKAAMAVLFSAFLSPQQVYQYDLGQVFLPWYPSWLLVFHGIVFLLFVICLCAGVYSSRVLPRSWYFVHLLASFTILHRVLDGGLFYIEVFFALPLFVAVHWTLGQNRVISSRKLGKRVSLCFLLWGAVYLFIFPSFGLQAKYLLVAAFPSLLLYTGLFAAGLLLERGKRYLAAAAALSYVVLFPLVCLTTNLPHSAVYLHRYALLEVHPGLEFSVLLPRKLPVETTEVKQLGSRPIGRLWLYHLQALEREQLYRFKELNLNTGFYEAVFHTDSPYGCLKGEVKTFVWQVVVPDPELAGFEKDGKRWTLPTGDGVRGAILTPLGGNYYRMEVCFESCLPLLQSVLEEYLLSKGNVQLVLYGAEALSIPT